MNFKYIALAIICLLIGILYFNYNSITHFKYAIQTREITKKIDLLHAEINATLHTAATDISQCRLIPSGHKACGGPSRYLVYSVDVTDEEKLKKLLAEEEVLSTEIQKISHQISTCNLKLPPRLELISGNCVIKK